MTIAKWLKGKRVLITGGTGSLGRELTRNMLRQAELEEVRIFSRDEAKQHQMRIDFQGGGEEQAGLDYRKFVRDGRLKFVIGDVRNVSALSRAVDGSDVVICAAAMKQVPACEYYPHEAVLTNTGGAQNMVEAVRQAKNPPKTVIGVSTDKACKPINVYGMSKAIQERIFHTANLLCPHTRFVCVRYGNVLASRGSVIPLFHQQIASGGPVTITHPDMTRFFLTLHDAVQTIYAALIAGLPGETWVPIVPSAKITDLAQVLIAGGKNHAAGSVEVKRTSIRPGEKLHEILVSEDEIGRTFQENLAELGGERPVGWYRISPVLPELSLGHAADETSVAEAMRVLFGGAEYSSANHLMERQFLELILQKNNLLVPAASA